MDIEALCSGLASEATTIEGVPGFGLTGTGRRGLHRQDARGIGDGDEERGRDERRDITIGYIGRVKIKRAPAV